MAPVFHDWLEISRLLVSTMVKHPHTAAAFLTTLFVAIWWIVTGGLGNEEQTWKKPHGQLFPSTSLVYDIYNGSMEALMDILNFQQLHFVAYYAPWSSDSRRLVPEFIMAAKHFKKEVVFIAVNCWIGSCRGNYTFSSFPRLYGYHSKKPVEYLGQLDRHHMAKFLNILMRPFDVISQESQLTTFLRGNEVVVFAYFKWPVSCKEDQRYSVFFDVCLTSANQVNPPAFALITREEVARRLRLEVHSDIQLRNPYNQVVAYPRNFNYTMNDINGWVYMNKKKVVLELTPNASDLNYYRFHLKRGAAALLFLPSRSKGRMSTLSLFRKMAMTYHNCSCVTERPQENSLSLNPVVSPSSTRGRPNFCISRKKTAGFRSPWCLVEVCHSCSHHCSSVNGMFYLSRHLEGKGMIAETCHEARDCRSLQFGDYYHGNLIVVCQVEFHARSKEKNTLLESDSEQEPEVQTVLSLLKTLQAALAASLQSMEGNAYLALQPNAGIMTDGPDVVARSPQKVDKSNRTLPQGRGTHYQAAGTNLCPAKMTPSFIEALKKDTVGLFAGLKCRTNRTVNFFFLDSDRYFPIVRALGINESQLVESGTSLAIVDVKNEATYVLPEEIKIQQPSIASFIVNFTLGTLQRRLRSTSVTPKQVCFRDDRGPFCFVEVSSQSFKEVVLAREKDVLLLYTVPWCGHCRVADHLFLQLVNIFRAIGSLVFARIDSDRNDLPYEYTVDGFPKLVLFPARRKEDSMHFPEESSWTLQNLIHFLSRHSSEKTRLSIRTLVRGIG